MHKHRPNFIVYLAFKYLKGYYLSENDFAKSTFKCAKCGQRIRFKDSRKKFYGIWMLVVLALFPIMALVAWGMAMNFSSENGMFLIIAGLMLIFVIVCIPDAVLYFTTKYESLEE